MKTARKVLVLALCAVLLVSATIMGTMAYLTSTDEVTNTFTVGNVTITLDEAKVNTDGTFVTDATNRTDANEYHLIPGHSYIKDPTVHVDANSEKCWLFVKLDNGLKDIIAATTIEDQMADKGWSLVSGQTNVYAYRSVVSAQDNIPVFDSFKLTSDAAVSGYTNAQIVVTAYAVQADGFDTSADAWNAAPSSWN